MIEAPIAEYEVAMAGLQATQDDLVAMLRATEPLNKNEVGQWAIRHNDALTELCRSIRILVERIRDER